MNSVKRFFSTATVLLILLYTFIFSAVAISDKVTTVSRFYSYDEKLLCVSHRGDTAFYPENSLEGVISALEKGADFVSVNLEKTSDGVFYLCEDESLGNVCDAPYDSLSQMKAAEVEKYYLYDIYGKETKLRMTSLQKLINETDSKDGIILDIKPEYKDEVYSVLKDNNALDRIILRVDESGCKLASWAESKDERVHIIGKYTGNIIFSTISQIKNLTDAELSAVQYESKNYFNVAFGAFFTNRYLVTENVRAVAATYSPDLCGQRGDSFDGWNELIGKGYSVIETNNIEAFAMYKQEAERLEKSIAELLEKSVYVDPAGYSEISVSNLEKAKQNAEALIAGAVFSLDEAEKCYSRLLFALEEMKISTGEVDTRGALNVTAGKIVATVLVGSALLAGQIYVYNMRKSKKTKG